MNDVAQTMSHIYTTLENQQEDHQASIIKMHGKIINQLISILIDQRYNLNYISPKVVKYYTMQKKENIKPWMVHFSMRFNKKVTELVESCHLELDGMATTKNINILFQGLYDVLIGMYELTGHKTNVDYDKK